LQFFIGLAYVDVMKKIDELGTDDWIEVEIHNLEVQLENAHQMNPKDIDDIVVMRIVIRQGMSRDMADMLLKDIANAVAELDKLKHPTPSKEEQRRKGRVFTH
jgi:glutamate/tyrosine decarboxylase-like PLP-dependent enzyme